MGKKKLVILSVALFLMGVFAAIADFYIFMSTAVPGKDMDVSADTSENVDLAAGDSIADDADQQAVYGTAAGFTVLGEGSKTEKTEIGETKEKISGTQDDTRDETSDAQAVLEQFGIDKGTKEDYSAALNTEEYLYYDSEISDFSFYYPAGLYQDVSYDQSAAETAYGINVERIAFQASKGSELVFTLTERTDQLSMEQITNYV